MSQLTDEEILTTKACARAAVTVQDTVNAVIQACAVSHSGNPMIAALNELADYAPFAAMLDDVARQLFKRIQIGQEVSPDASDFADKVQHLSWLSFSLAMKELDKIQLAQKLTK